MIVLYFEIEDVEVTNKLDVLKRDISMELSIFCFQWILVYWTLELASSFVSRRANTIWSRVKIGLTICLIVVAVGYLYYRNLQILLQVRDMNDNLTKEELEAPTQSNFILIAFVPLLFCANFSWFLMNFSLGFFGASFVAIMFNDRRYRRRNQE